jgi:hypothetical protein
MTNHIQVPFYGYEVLLYDDETDTCETITVWVPDPCPVYPPSDRCDDWYADILLPAVDEHHDSDLMDDWWPVGWES